MSGHADLRLGRRARGQLARQLFLRTLLSGGVLGLPAEVLLRVDADLVRRARLDHALGDGFPLSSMRLQARQEALMLGSGPATSCHRHVRLGTRGCGARHGWRGREGGSTRLPAARKSREQRTAHSEARSPKDVNQEEVSSWAARMKRAALYTRAATVLKRRAAQSCAPTTRKTLPVPA